MEFLELYSSKNSKNVYRAGIIKFLEFVYNRKKKKGKIVNEEMKEFEELAEQYFDENRNYGEDLVKFASFLAKQNVPPKTSSAYVSAVKEWFLWNNLELSQRTMKEVRHKLPKGGVRTEEEEMTKEKLRKILNCCDLSGRALFLLLATTGMRLGEALALELDDLKLDENPPRVIIRGENTKTGEMREVFLTQEAKEILLQWLSVRDKFLRESYEKVKNFMKIGKTPIDLRDRRVFPFSKSKVERLWHEVLEKAELLRKDKSTGRATIVIHSLRKYFRTRLAKARVPAEMIDALMGHSRSSLRQVYTKFSPEEVIEMWKKAEIELTVFGSPEAEELRKKLKEKEEELKKKEQELQQRFKEMQQQLMSEVEMKLQQESIIHKATVEGLVKDKIELEQRIQKLERQIEELKSYIIAILKGKVDKAIPFARSDEDVFKLLKQDSEVLEFLED